MAGIDVTLSGILSVNFKLITDNVEVVDLLCTAGVTVAALYARRGTTSITLGTLFLVYKFAKLITDAVVKAFGGPRDDQEVRDIREGSLLVELHCFTDERFLEVLADYESGEIKKRLEEEFSQVGIKVEGLKVEIENLAEVNETKEAINKRYHRCMMKILTRVEHAYSVLSFNKALYCDRTMQIVFWHRGHFS
jgi:hypothetical protein